MNTFSLKVIACDRVFFDGRCEQVVLPLHDGEKAIQAHHENMVFAVELKLVVYRMLTYNRIAKRLSQNRVEMASFVLFQIEVIWIFLKRSLQTYFFHSNCFLLV